MSSASTRKGVDATPTTKAMIEVETSEAVKTNKTKNENSELKEDQKKTMPAPRTATTRSKKTKSKDGAVKIHFKAVGGAPIMKRRKFKMKPDRAWSVVSSFLRKQLKLKTTEPLFTYVNSAFSPSPDQLVGNLFESFQINDELIVNYCRTNAWG
eukprot:g2740.t1